jgi:glucosyl-3-phosphoglycerate phosphatase
VSQAPERATQGPARRLVLLRHGETAHNAKGIWQGQLDTPLSDIGHGQAMAAGRALGELRPDRVVSSDLTRALATARSVGSACGIPVETDSRLREIHAGIWQGLTGAEVEARWPQERAAIARGEDIARGERGESMGDVVARVGAALGDTIASMPAGECVVISTHGAAGRAAAAWLLGLEHQVAWRVFGAFANCHWSEFAQGRLGWRLLTWNVGPGAVAPQPSGASASAPS